MAPRRPDGGAGLKLRAGLVAAHRRLSLAAVVFWLVQAATGIVAVFHWEIDDATVAGESRSLDFAAIEQRAAALAAAAPGRHIDSIWSTAAGTHRLDIFVAATPPDSGRIVRVDGTGRVLRTRVDGERWAHGGFVESVVLLHQKLLVGERGKWIVGSSGLLLLANLILGAVVAWPRGGRWRRALLPGSTTPGPPRLFSWHRALGLWMVVPAACLVAAGVLLAFETATERLVRPLPVDPPALSLPPGAAPAVGMTQAVQAALQRYPEASLSGIGFPSPAAATWAIRLKQPGELRRAYGKTRVYVSALDGAIVADFDALASPPGRRFVDSLFAFHTGEMGGIAGRLAATAVGVWLVVMCGLGFRLWSSRRRRG